MGFKKLTNEQWSKIQPYLSKHADVGRSRANDRTTINGMIYVATTGCAWIDCLNSTGQSQLYTEDSKICKKKKSGKNFSKA